MFFRTKKEKTFMEREIFAQPKILSDILEGYLEDENIKLDIPTDIEKVVLVASGSSFNCARYCADLFDKIANIEAAAVYSSEFLLKTIVPHSDKMLYIFITQSGETSDTNKALMKAKEYNLKTLCITNAENSSIWKLSDYKINCRAGQEKSIAATKSLTAQMLCTTLLVLKYAQIKGIDVSYYLKDLQTLPSAINGTLGLRNNIQKHAKLLHTYKNIIVSADGMAYALARESALKIKETSYKNIYAMVLGEFMHGHVAVMNNKATLIYTSAEKISERSINNINNIQKDYCPTLVIIGNSDEKIKTDFHFNIDTKDEVQKMFANILIFQLIALETALELKCDVDNPKGLHKIVIEKSV